MCNVQHTSRRGGSNGKPQSCIAIAGRVCAGPDYDITVPFTTRFLSGFSQGGGENHMFQTRRLRLGFPTR